MPEAIATAIIPVAGHGTRLAPVTRALPKALFPVVLPDGTVRPVADLIAREALAAGCERICFVTSGGQDRLLREYFSGEERLSRRIEYVTDVEPYGFGYAVWMARGVAGGGAVMVLLGDHVHLPPPRGEPPARQVARAFVENSPAAVTGVQVVSTDRLGEVGVCRGDPLLGRLYRCTEVVEKPKAYGLRGAARRLATPGLPKGRYLAHAGIYVFAPEIFECLAGLVDRRPPRGEVGLTEAQRVLLARRPGEYFLWRIRGKTCDVGTPAGYLATLKAVSRASRPPA